MDHAIRHGANSREAFKGQDAHVVLVSNQLGDVTPDARIAQKSRQQKNGLT
jgi:hypothetical protein